MLLQAIIASSIGIVAALAISSMLVGQNKQLKLMEQKAEILDIKNQISSVLAVPHLCGCNLNPSKLSPSAGQPLEFSTTTQIPIASGLRYDCNKATSAFIKAGQRTSTHLKVDSIDVEPISQIGTSRSWMGNIRIKFSGSSISLKDITVPITLSTLSSSPPYKIDNCYVSGAPLRMESGHEVIPDGCYQTDGNRVNFATSYFCSSGGYPGKKITFSQPFSSPPTVIVTLAGPSADSSLISCTGGAMDQVGTNYSHATATDFVALAWMSPYGSICPPWSDNAGAIKFNWYAIGL